MPVVETGSDVPFSKAGPESLSSNDIRCVMIFAWLLMMEECFPPVLLTVPVLLLVIRFALYSFYFRVQKAKLLLAPPSKESLWPPVV